MEYFTIFCRDIIQRTLVLLYVTQIKEVIDIKKLSHMQNISFTPDTWDNIETTEDLPIHHEKLMEQTIQQIKIDMYKDRYKTYGNFHTSYFYAHF